MALQLFVSVFSSSPYKDIDKEVNNLNLIKSSTVENFLKNIHFDFMKLLMMLSNLKDSLKSLFDMHLKYLFTISIITLFTLKTSIKLCLFPILKKYKISFCKFYNFTLNSIFFSDDISKRLSPESEGQKTTISSHMAVCQPFPRHHLNNYKKYTPMKPFSEEKSTYH